MLFCEETAIAVTVEIRRMLLTDVGPPYGPRQGVGPNLE
jgi:hypothetical protein